MKALLCFLIGHDTGRVWYWDSARQQWFRDYRYCARCERRDLMILSILTPAVPSRIVQDLDWDSGRWRQGPLLKLIDKLHRQIGNLPVEHLVLLDNKRRTVGEKRDALLRAARGRYVAFVDDDDYIADDYVAEILRAASPSPGGEGRGEGERPPDVITFMQHCRVNGVEFYVDFKLGNPNDPPPTSGDRHDLIRRNAWHTCAWRRELAILSSFPAVNYGEDWSYASRLCALPNLKEVHLPKILHYYRHDARTTEAPPPL